MLDVLGSQFHKTTKSYFATRKQRTIRRTERMWKEAAAMPAQDHTKIIIKLRCIMRYQNILTSLPLLPPPAAPAPQMPLLRHYRRGKSLLDYAWKNTVSHFFVCFCNIPPSILKKKQKISSPQPWHQILPDEMSRLLSSLRIHNSFACLQVQSLNTDVGHHVNGKGSVLP